MTALAFKKDARLDLKTTQQNKELLSQAAVLRGVDMTTFIMELALKGAREVIEHNAQVMLNKNEQLTLFNVLSKPNKPTEGLKELLSAGTFSER